MMAHAGSFSARDNDIAAVRPAPLAVLAVQGDLEPDRLAVLGWAGAPAGGQLLHQVEPAAALVGRPCRAQSGQPKVRVEYLHPHRLRPPPQAQGELAWPVHR